MVALLALVASLLALSSQAAAVPVGASRTSIADLKFPSIPEGAWWCEYSPPWLQKLLCSRSLSTSSTSVSTPFGTAEGVVDTSGVVRFTVKYGTANRWQPSSVAMAWDLPSGASNASGLPLACPQSGLDASEYSEDCLSMILYVPSSVTIGSNAPALMWIHGGSFISGSATGAGLDGSALAAATESIVAVIQYRLGALGFMAPNGQTNLAVKDTITALQFLQAVLPAFGGDTSKITVDGQSSGANMIRALLAAPSVSNLFEYAILQSDPMDYGFLNTTMQSSLQDYFNGQLSCSASDTSCLDSLSLDDILTAQSALSDNAYSVVPAAGQSEPIRPVRDGSLITSPLDLTAAFPSQSKTIMLTNVVDEAMYTIYSEFPSAISSSYYDDVVDGTFGSVSGSRLLSYSTYVPSSTPADGTQDARPQLSQMGTDQLGVERRYRVCGMYTVGASYPGNSDVSECTDSGSVCHQDDIEIVFGTAPSPTSAQSALITEIQARYYQFLRTGNPNSGSYATWGATDGQTVSALELGSSGAYAAGACDPSQWGDAVPYDYQVYDI
ncbi:Alpha/Beta hydrolase protein [Fomitopsis serialis]|uniref:Alpha/Beta hydrolase protein n=1 Tax=Fomitopsis serialis TaxID=139415 RepID=UPI00200751DD|nr:Alpha/Beta hydrolase protein [Neoantrodia serialis]KAH9928173.1 Alpha/Beta hydrolase protein [Neoantrodia serialis]